MYICEICGREFDKKHFSGKFENICGLGNCFHEKFWRIIADEKDEHVFINGGSYYIEDENKGGIRGFDGRKFRIRKNDGTEIVTTNLWYQGQIPDNFKDILPDNAEFIRES